MVASDAHVIDAEFVRGELLEISVDGDEFFGGEFFGEAGDGRRDLLHGINQERDDAGVADAVWAAFVVVADERRVHRVDFLGDEGARIMLANCVLNIAAQGERDPIRLKEGALRTFFLTNP